MTGDLRSQILIDVRAQGADGVTAVEQQLARLRQEMQQAVTGFTQGSVKSAEFEKSIRALGSAFNFYIGILKEVRAAEDGLDAATQKQMKSAEDLAAKREQLDQQVNAMLAAGVEERIRQAHKEADAREAAELKEADAHAKLFAAYEASEAKRVAIAEQSAAKQVSAVQDAAQRRMKLESQVNAMVEEAAIVTEQAEMRKADAMAKEAVAQEKLLADYEKWVTQSTASAAATTRITTATKDATSTAWQYQVAVQQIGYGLGDLMQTSGGWERKLMSITNNIQFALAPFGMWGVAVGVLATTIASVAMNWDSLAELVETRNPIPESTDAVHRLESELKNVNHELTEMQKHTSLNNEDTEKYNGLLAKQIKLEKEKTEEIKRRKELEKLGEATNEPGYSADKERTKGLEDIIGREGGSESFIQSVMDAQLKKDLEDKERLYEHATQMTSEYKRTGKLDPHYKPIIDELYKVVARINNVSGERRKFAEEMVRGGVVRGETTPFMDILGLMNRAPGAFTEGQVSGFKGYDPEALAKFDAEAEAFDARMRRAEEAGFRRRQKKAASDKLGRELTEQGRNDEREDVRKAAEEAGLPGSPSTFEALDRALKQRAKHEEAAGARKTARDQTKAGRAAQRQAKGQQHLTDAFGQHLQNDAIDDFMMENQILHAQMAVMNAKTYSAAQRAMMGLQALAMRMQAEQARRDMEFQRYTSQMGITQPSLMPPVPFR